MFPPGPGVIASAKRPDRNAPGPPTPVVDIDCSADPCEQSPSAMQNPNQILPSDPTARFENIVSSSPNSGNVEMLAVGVIRPKKFESWKFVLASSQKTAPLAPTMPDSQFTKPKSSDGRLKQ